MKFQKTLMGSAVALMIGGCASPVPVAQNFDMSYQKVARTAHHWDVVADDVIAQTTASIQKIASLQNRPIYVVPYETSSAFDRAFRNFMITRLVDRGLSVNVCQNEPQPKTGFTLAPGLPALDVKYETQVIVHKGKLPNYRPGALTWLTADIAAIYNLSKQPLLHSKDLTYAGAAGLVVANDIALGHVAAPTRTELVVTTTISENNKYIMRKNDVYYIPDADAQLFSNRTHQNLPCSRASESKTADASSAANVATKNEEAMQEKLASAMRRSNPNWRQGATSDE